MTPHMTELQLKVRRLTGNRKALNDRLYLSPGSMGLLLSPTDDGRERESPKAVVGHSGGKPLVAVAIGSHAYEAGEDPDVADGEIAVNGLQRRFLKLDEGDMVALKLIVPNMTEAEDGPPSVELSIDIPAKRGSHHGGGQSWTIDTDHLLDHLQSESFEWQKHFFEAGRMFATKFEERLIILTVNNIRFRGVRGEDGLPPIQQDDPSQQLISTRLVSFSVNDCPDVVLTGSRVSGSLFMAIREGRPKCEVETLCGISPALALRERDNFGSTPLHEAFCFEAPREVKEFLISKHPKDLLLKDHEEMTALHLACRYNSPIELIRSLVEVCPLAVEMGDKNGTLPLHYASWGSNDAGVVSFLTEKYPNSLSLKDTFYGRAPLHFACACTCHGRSSLEIVRYLASKCPEMMGEVDCNGFNPLHLACSEHPVCEPGIFSVDVVEHICKNFPMALKTASSYGKLPLHLACEWNAPLALIQVLVESCPGALRTKDAKGWTPLHHTCEAAACNQDVSLELVMLLAGGSPVHEKDEEGRTPFDIMDQIILKRASCNGQIENSPGLERIYRFMMDL